MAGGSTLDLSVPYAIVALHAAVISHRLLVFSWVVLASLEPYVTIMSAQLPTKAITSGTKMERHIVTFQTSWSHLPFSNYSFAAGSSSAVGTLFRQLRSKTSKPSLIRREPLYSTNLIMALFMESLCKNKMHRRDRWSSLSTEYQSYSLFKYILKLQPK